MVSKRAAAISASATLAIDTKAKEFSQAGYQVINFSAGQLDSPTPKNVAQAAKTAIEENFSRYTPVAGITELKQAIAKRFKLNNNLNYDPAQIMVTSGGKQALFNLIFVLIDEQDEVILPTPAWVSYPEQIKICGGKPILLDSGSNFKITADQLEKAISKKTKLLILNSPSNPTGAIYNKQELLSLAKVIVKHKIWAISDEVYEKIVFDQQKHISIASLGKQIYQQTLIVNAASKTYAMTGWRIGWAAGNEKIISAATRLQAHTTSNACSISQKAALAGLTGSQAFIKPIVKKLDQRRKVLVAGLKQIKGFETKLPQGAFYVFVNIKKIEPDSAKFCQELIEDQKVACVPG